MHSATYLADLEAFCNQGGGDLDPDTYARSDSLVRLAGRLAPALKPSPRWSVTAREWPSSRHNPPATTPSDRAMGFCLVNNVAVSTASLTAKGHRVLIVDWDVHHGNGTQSIFWDDPNVLYVSTHQWPLFPGTGRAEEVERTAMLWGSS